MKCAPGFVHLLQGFDQNHLESFDGCIFGLWPDLTLAYTNPAWDRFAIDNGGDPSLLSWQHRKTSVLESCTEAFRSSVRDGFDHCIKNRAPWEYVYECSSSDVFRVFRQKSYPLEAQQGVLVVNTLVEQRPHHEGSEVAKVEHYVDKHGTLRQCSHCRRVQVGDEEFRWRWVSAWVSQAPEQTSHGLCPPCFSFYYPPPPGRQKRKGEPKGNK